MSNMSYPPDMTKPPRYVSANLTPSVAADLRALIATMTIATGRRVTTSALVSALITWGKTHPDELASSLTGDDDNE